MSSKGDITLFHLHCNMLVHIQMLSCLSANFKSFDLLVYIGLQTLCHLS